jgi:Cytidylate kinase-like family
LASSAAIYNPRRSSKKRPANRGACDHHLTRGRRRRENGRRTARPAIDRRRKDASPGVVFDANLAKQVLEDHKLAPNLERFMTEDTQLLPVEAIVEEVLGLHPSGWTLVQHTTQTILRLAGLGHTILVGRGGNVITARLPNVFHVRLVAPLATRIRHAAEYYHLSETEAAKLVREQDQARRRYARRYFNAEIDDPTLYDVTLNTGRLGFARAAEIIAQLALQYRHAFAEREP